MDMYMDLDLAWCLTQFMLLFSDDVVCLDPDLYNSKPSTISKLTVPAFQHLFLPLLIASSLDVPLITELRWNLFLAFL
ncbi:hypothetical protein SADUNF_Sadunf14G0014500 [Salix dunnii]|uniref:Uncharacterized protein n=1 Tax=Salix dunnii TaxID=1413687 RepID=A0A835JHF4_9ROSI|nr:hypothetical protein SADUNF_Sadunf14G0014500 [Salix dunnii]